MIDENGNKRPGTQGIDITGQKFGSLTAIGFAERRNSKVYWRFQCDCGNETVTLKSPVMRGIVKHCAECGHKLQAEAVRRHGGYNTPEYKIYMAAKCRCNSANDERYDDYGGRGIEFRFNSFEEFIEHIGFRQSADLSLDRIDNDGHYEPGNVRWATIAEQAVNKRPRRWQKRPSGSVGVEDTKVAAM